MEKQVLVPQVGTFKLRVRKSLTGKGLFTEEKIPKGRFIIEYIGKDVPPAMQFTQSKYLFEITKKKMINGNITENTARYINHSCKPNCEADIIKGHVRISSIRNIHAGEELFYDYGEEYFNEHIKPKGCRCEKCSKVYL